MPKYSISLTDELAKEISDRYPDSPFSTAIAKLVRRGLDADTTDTTNPTLPTSPTPAIITPGPEEIATMIRAVVQDEISKIQVPAVVVESQETSAPVVVQEAPQVDSHEWLTGSEVAELLPATMPRGTKSARVSRAISSGKLKTNGQSGKKCRVHRSDALAWVQA